MIVLLFYFLPYPSHWVFGAEMTCFFCFFLLFSEANDSYTLALFSLSHGKVVLFNNV